jgi:cytochrome oxidase Cu insertion factor (SCO1/SenC/PrrC family)
MRDPTHPRAIYLVDPLGQVMMRYPDQPDPKKMIKDFQRLMKYSRLG